MTFCISAFVKSRPQILDACLSLGKDKNMNEHNEKRKFLFDDPRYQSFPYYKRTGEELNFLNCANEIFRQEFVVEVLLLLFFKEKKNNSFFSSFGLVFTPFLLLGLLLDQAKREKNYFLNCISSRFQTCYYNSHRVFLQLEMKE